jgi:hypothetical protein
MTNDNTLAIGGRLVLNLFILSPSSNPHEFDEFAACTWLIHMQERDGIQGGNVNTRPHSLPLGPELC